jgi:succinate dehydrogenase/fumarate reductase flavoprotein subunit
MERLEDLAVSNPERVIVKKKARVTKLIKDGSTVIGVEYIVGGKTETAYGPVVLATGGYAADFTQDSLLKKYRPEYWELPTTNGDHCTGDGHKIAISIGASSIDMEKVQVHPTGLVDPNEPGAKVKFLAAEALRGVGGLLLNSEGERFVDELQHRDYVTGKIWEQKGKVCPALHLLSLTFIDHRVFSIRSGSFSTVKLPSRSSGTASTTLAVAL